MSKRPQFLCVVYDINTHQSLAEYTIEAVDVYYSRHIAAKKYTDENPSENNNPNWKVDSVIID